MLCFVPFSKSIQSVRFSLPLFILVVLPKLPSAVSNRVIFDDLPLQGILSGDENDFSAFSPDTVHVFLPHHVKQLGGSQSTLSRLAVLSEWNAWRAVQHGQQLRTRSERSRKRGIDAVGLIMGDQQ